MSIIHEIHSQRPAVRITLFALSVATTVLIVVFFLASSIQKDFYFVMHKDPAEQQAFLARRAASRPQPVAAIARAADSLMASIGSLIGWNDKAGFDTKERQDTLQGEVHLLPLSE